MDLSWLGTTGVATVVASLISSGVVVWLDRKRHPGPDLRIQKPETVENDGFYEITRRFELVNVGPDPAYDVSVSGGPPFAVRASSAVNGDTQTVLPVLAPGEGADLTVRVTDESKLGKATLVLRWNTRSGRARTESHDRSAKERTHRLVDLL